MEKFEIVEKLLNEKGITAYQASKDIGIYPTVFSDWKHGRSKPKADKLKLIADYLEIPIEEII